MESIVVRFATSADVPILHQRSHLAERIVQRKVAWQEMIVGEWNNAVIGALHLEYIWNSVPYIALIYVVADYQRRGCGKALLQFLETFLREQGHAMLYSSSQVDEPEPQAWHRHVGFEECGIIAGINKGVGEVFFRKRLV